MCLPKGTKLVIDGQPCTVQASVGDRIVARTQAPKKEDQIPLVRDVKFERPTRRLALSHSTKHD